MLFPQEGSYDLCTPDSDSSLYFSSELLEQLYFCDFLIDPWLPFTPYLRKAPYSLNSSTACDTQQVLNNDRFKKCVHLCVWKAESKKGQCSLLITIQLILGKLAWDPRLFPLHKAGRVCLDPVFKFFLLPWLTPYPTFRSSLFCPKIGSQFRPSAGWRWGIKWLWRQTWVLSLTNRITWGKLLTSPGPQFTQQ